MTNHKDKTATLLFAFFLGGVGGHWFYLGRTLRGALYLIFAWTFIPALLAFCEFFWILGMSKHKFRKTFEQEEV